MTPPTPGPCECTTKENGFGYQEIVYCPLHAQAGALREALERIKLGPCSCGYDNKFPCPHDIARAILKEIDG